MKKNVVFLALMLMFAISQGQNVFTFDELTIPDTGFWNGSDTSVYSTNFGDEIVSFENSYNADWDAWSGFSFSMWTDTTTEGDSNQWSVYAGQAHSDTVFGLAYVPTDFVTYKTIPITCTFAQPVIPDGIFVTNSTYTALAIKNGTNFSQPFSDGDYYLLKVYGYKNGQITDSIIHYLADYRNGQTFIQKEWTALDLSTLDTVDMIKFDVFSSDTGSYGINTPAYFCIDDLKYTLPTTAINAEQNQIVVFPNPAQNFIHLNVNYDKIIIYDISGRIVRQTDNTTIWVSDLNSGTYFIKIYSSEGIRNVKFIKK